MDMFTTKGIQQIFEQALHTGVETFRTQAGYVEDLAERHGKAVSSLAAVSLSSLKALAGSRSFTEAFETNLALEESIREELLRLHDENLQAWKVLQSDLKVILLPANDSVQVKEKKAAPKSRKAA